MSGGVDSSSGRKWSLQGNRWMRGTLSHILFTQCSLIAPELLTSHQEDTLFFSCDRINLTGGEVQRLNVMSLILIQPPLASVSYSHVLYVYNWVDAPQKGINNIIYMLLSTFATIKRDLLAGKALQKLIKAKSCFSFPKTSDGEPCALLIIIIILPKLWPLNSVKWKFWHSARKPCQVTWQTKSFWWMLCEDDLCSTPSIIPQVTLQVHH